jgi:hypothetical protein
MGSRHLICVVLDKEYKVAQYGQWDGYFEGAGTDILKFLEIAPLITFKAKLKDIKFLDESKIKALYDIYENNFSKKFPEFSRDTSSDIFKLILNGQVTLLQNSIEFAGDPLFCEYGYVIDLDENTFEIYEGAIDAEPNINERFTNIKYQKDMESVIKHLHTFDINNLPTSEEFVNILTEKEENS